MARTKLNTITAPSAQPGFETLRAFTAPASVRAEWFALPHA